MVARTVLGLSVMVDRSRVWWSKGIRTGLVVSLVTLIGLQYLSGSAVLSLALGAAFVGISDTTDPDRNRFAGLLLSLVTYAVAVVVGGAIADSDWTRVVGSAVLAGICGYAVVVGPRTALAGVISLVLVTVYAGTPGTLIGGVESAGWLLLGGAAYLMVALPGWPLHRFSGLRTSLSMTYRAVGLAARSPGHAISSTAVAMAPLVTLEGVRNGDTRGVTREWAMGLAEDADAARRSLAALSTHHSDPADVFRLAAGEALRQVGGALRIPGRRAAVDKAVAVSNEAAQSAVRGGVPAVLVAAVVEPVQRAATSVTEPWPLGGRAETGPPSPLFPDPLTRVREGLRWSDSALQHGLRLAVAIAIATTLAALSPSEHSYWIPLTVAWITRPDLGGTVTRVVMRVAGTVLGVGVAWVIAPYITDDLTYAVAVGAGAFTIAAFLTANYPVATAGITTMVLILLGSVGEPVRSTAGDRILDTVAAGLVVLIVALVAPRTGGRSAHADLAELARQGAAYSDAVLAGQPGDMARMRLAVLHARTQAENAALAAAQEPVRHELAPMVALEIMADLRLVSEQLLVWHETIGDVPPPDGLAAMARSGLTSLADRLATPRDPGEPWEFPAALPEAATDLLGPIAHAHRRLTDATA